MSSASAPTAAAPLRTAAGESLAKSQSLLLGFTLRLKRHRRSLSECRRGPEGHRFPQRSVLSVGVCECHEFSWPSGPPLPATASALPNSSQPELTVERGSAWIAAPTNTTKSTSFSNFEWDSVRNDAKRDALRGHLHLSIRMQLVPIERANRWSGGGGQKQIAAVVISRFDSIERTFDALRFTCL